MKILFVVYANAESLLEKKIRKCKNNPDTSFTTKTLFTTHQLPLFNIYAKEILNMIAIVTKKRACNGNN